MVVPSVYVKPLITAPVATPNVVSAAVLPLLDKPKPLPVINWYKVPDAWFAVVTGVVVRAGPYPKRPVGLNSVKSEYTIPHRCMFINLLTTNFNFTCFN